MSDWQRVQQLFTSAVELPRGRQVRFLKESCGSDVALYADVVSLLEADTDNGETIESAVREEASRLLESEAEEGSRFGSYVIVREIGRGGMGSVYLALRDDNEFRREVALKIVKRGMDTAEVLKRFRYERQILANLEHPYIARLIDGGSTNHGVPFFVMEYVDGKPVDAFCRENLKDYRTRCELFLRILEAVSYAHRSLVVHRDLKPANILVTSDGRPKLLDFGVAKLLDGDSVANSKLTADHRPFTPAYASPEQVLGLPITTATDIYALGAIFYELLIGRPAQVISIYTPQEIERVVCQSQIKKDALHSHGLHRDLDNIVAMATRKEPERRYHSAQEFAEDIRRHLEGMPVLACPDSLAYRTTKFILRNRWQVAASVLVASSLFAGLAVSVLQTHRARLARRNAEAARLVAVEQTSLARAAAQAEARQRKIADQQEILANEQRDQAQHLKAIADQRTTAILDLANNTLFDIHDSIEKLPGSLDARRTLVKTTLEYLEKLEQQEGLDDRMRAALCAAYYKVAMMQGNPQGASLQEFDLAEKSLQKGQSLLMPAYQRHPNDPDLMMRLIEVRSTLADLMYRSGRREEGIQVNRDLLPVTHRLFLSTSPSCGLECRTQEPVLDNALTYELLGTDPVEAMTRAKNGIAIMQDLLKTNPDDETLKQGLGTLTAGAAGAYRATGDLSHAGDYYRQSIAMREDLLRVDPHNVAIRRNLMIAYGNYATLLGIPWSANLGKPEEARIYARKSVELARETVAGDANDITGRHDLGMSLSRLGMIDPAPDEVAQSLADLQEAESFIRPIAANNPKSAETASQVALILEYEGHRLETLGRNADAMASYRSSLTAIQPFFDQQNAVVFTQYLTDEDSIALLDLTLGDTAEALREANQAVSQARTICDRGCRTDRQTLNLAETWATLAITQSKTGRASEARESAARAMDLWKSVTKPGALLTERDIMAKTEALLTLHAAQ